MPKKRFSAEQIVILLRQIEVLISQSKSAPIACRDAGISQQSYRDELLNGEIFYSLKEAKAVIGQWRSHYNAVRPHSSLGYRPPAPQAYSPGPPTLDQAAAMQ
jgi:putative transposase